MSQNGNSDDTDDDGNDIRVNDAVLVNLQALVDNDNDNNARNDEQILNNEKGFVILSILAVGRRILFGSISNLYL